MSRFKQTPVLLCAVFVAFGCTTKPPVGTERASGDGAGAAADAGDRQPGADALQPRARGAQGAAATAVAAPAAVSAIADLLPADTLVYFSLDDLARARKEFEGTALKKLYDEPEFQAFLERPLTKFRQLTAEAEQESGIAFDDVLVAFGGQVAIALTALGPGEGTPHLAALAMATVTDKTAAARLLDLAVAAAKKDPPNRAALSDVDRNGWRGIKIVSEVADEPNVVLALSDSMALAGIYTRGDTTVEAILDGKRPAAALSGSDDFRRVMGKLGARRVYTAYAAVDSLRTAIIEIARKENPEQTALAERIISKLGLDAMVSIGGGLTIDVPGMTHRMYVRSPAPREGVFSVFPTDDLDARTRAAATSESMSFMAAQFDPSALLKVIRDVAELVGQRPQIDQALLQGGAMLGINIEKDLIGNVGTEVIVTAFPGGQAANPMVAPYLGLAMAVELKDSQKIGSIVTMLLGIADMMLTAQGMQIKQEEYQGVTFKSVDVQGIIAPCLAVTASHLVIAGSKVAAKKIVTLLSGINPSPLVDTREFGELVKRVGGLDGPQMIYSNTAEGVGQGMDSLRTALGMMPRGGARELEEWIDLGKLPSNATLAKHMFGQLDVVHVEEDGLLFVGHGPFGGWTAPVIVGASVGGVIGAVGMSSRGALPPPEPDEEDEGDEEDDEFDEMF